MPALLKKGGCQGKGAQVKTHSERSVDTGRTIAVNVNFFPIYFHK